MHKCSPFFVFSWIEYILLCYTLILLSFLGNITISTPSLSISLSLALLGEYSFVCSKQVLVSTIPLTPPWALVESFYTRRWQLGFYSYSLTFVTIFWRRTLSSLFVICYNPHNPNVLFLFTSTIHRCIRVCERKNPSLCLQDILKYLSIVKYHTKRSNGLSKP